MSKIAENESLAFINIMSSYDSKIFEPFIESLDQLESVSGNGHPQSLDSCCLLVAFLDNDCVMPLQDST